MRDAPDVPELQEHPAPGGVDGIGHLAPAGDLQPLTLQLGLQSGARRLRHLEHPRPIRGELGEVRATVTRIESALATKVDRDEIEPIVERVLARR